MARTPRSRRPPALLIALAALILGSVALAHAPGDPIRTVEGWSTATSRQLERVQPGTLDLALAELASVTGRERREQADRALLALAGRLHRGPLPSAHEQTLAEHVDGALDARRASDRDGRFVRFVLEQVALMEASVSLEARHGACRVLSGVDGREVTAALAMLCDDASDVIAGAATAALVGRPDHIATGQLLGRLLAAQAQIPWDEQALLTAHLDLLAARGLSAATLDPRLEGRLAEYAVPRTLHPDWRVASDAIRLVRHLRPDRGCAALTEALRIWTEREAAALEERDSPAVGTRRVRHECARALAAITGRELGIDVRRWESFWSAVREGAPLAPTDTGESRTVAEFFGIEIDSNAVAFAIDASGSMSTMFWDPDGRYGSRSSGATRYQVAAAELERALTRLPTSATFRLVFFNDGAEHYERQARRPDADQRLEVSRWIARREPEGGTSLSVGLELLERDALVAGGKGLDVDTVVILCDGQTEETAVWAEGWINGPNRTNHLRVHAVRIGGSASATTDPCPHCAGIPGTAHIGGALELLAGRTGGQFLRVDG